MALIVANNDENYSQIDVISAALSAAAQRGPPNSAAIAVKAKNGAEISDAASSIIERLTQYGLGVDTTAKNLEPDSDAASSLHDHNPPDISAPQDGSNSDDRAVLAVSAARAPAPAPPAEAAKARIEGDVH